MLISVDIGHCATTQSNNCYWVIVENNNVIQLVKWQSLTEWCFQLIEILSVVKICVNVFLLGEVCITKLKMVSARNVKYCYEQYLKLRGHPLDLYYCLFLAGLIISSCR